MTSIDTILHMSAFISRNYNAPFVRFTNLHGLILFLSSHDMEQKLTGFTAVFSEDWNWSFNPRNLRSRRHAFHQSGEMIYGFAAVFCEDWRDEWICDEVSPHFHEQPRLPTRRSTRRFKGRKRKRPISNFNSLGVGDELLSAVSAREKQNWEHCKLQGIEIPIFSEQPADCQQFNESKMGSRWPSSPESMHTTSHAPQNIGVADSPTKRTAYTSSHAIIDNASIYNLEMQQASAPDQRQSYVTPSALMKSTTATQQADVSPYKGLPGHGSVELSDGETTGMGQDFWAALLKCNTGLGGCEDIQNLEEPTLM